MDRPSDPSARRLTDDEEWVGQWDEAPAPPRGPVPGLLARFPRDRWRRTLIELAVLLAVAWALTHDWSSGSRSEASVAAAYHSVRYELAGTAGAASLTVTTPGGGTKQEAEVGVPLGTSNGGTGLTYRFRSGEFVYVSAQIPGWVETFEESPTITCRIYVDDRLVQENTSRGLYQIVTCSGRV